MPWPSSQFRSSCPKILPTPLPLNIMNPRTCPFIYSLFRHNRNQSSLYPHSLRSSRKTSIIQSHLGKMRSLVPFQYLDHCDLRTKTQEPIEDEDCCALARAHGGEESASRTDDKIDLRASQTCFSSMDEARTGRSWHSLNS
jgi:hypothetical protein